MKVDKKKSSISFTADAYEMIDSYLSSLKMTSTVPAGINRSDIVNKFIKALCPLDKDVRRELYNFCYRREEQIKEAMRDASGYEKAQLSEKAVEFDRLVEVFNCFCVIRPEPQAPVAMQKVQMYGKKAYFPESWIILNKSDASESVCAYVVDIYQKDAADLHFVYFSHEPAVEMKKGSRLWKEILCQCRRKWPEFSEIEKHQVDPVYDGYDENGCPILINEDDLKRGPRVLICNLPVLGSRLSYPYNAMIVNSDREIEP